MEVNLVMLDVILEELKPYRAELVAVSKKKPAQSVKTVYNHGHRDFGENYVQELLLKQGELPGDIRWHFIGHLQSNKVKQIAPFVHLIHGIDSPELANTVNRYAGSMNRSIDMLLQVHIASEETKFGFSGDEVLNFMEDFSSLSLPGIKIKGLMGMASFTDNSDQVRSEFRGLRKLFDTIRNGSDVEQRSDFSILSMGMTGDYKIALDEGSNMVRIGSAIFGERS